MAKPSADILLCSYRVSGRTWLRFMLADCIARACGWDREVDLTTCFRWLPNWSWNERTGWGVFEPERLGGLPVIAAAHDRFRPILRKQRIIWLYRDPMDILTSRFSRRADEFARLDLDHYLSASGDALSYAEWLNSWASGLKKCKDHRMIRYEDLAEDRGREIEKLCAYCAIPLSETDLARVVERGSLEAMRTIQSDAGVGGADEKRVREGGVRKFEQKLRPEERTLLAHALQDVLEPAALELLDRLGSGVIAYAKSR